MIINRLEKLCIDPKYKKERLQYEDKKSSLALKTPLNFIESKNRKQSQSMKTAFNMAKDNGMNPVWITVDQALNMCNEIKYHVFIIESFKSDLFDKLYENVRCQIYGPACIYYCKNQLYLPRRNFPIFNLCMRNLEICIDEQFNDDDIVDLFGFINLMGGTFSCEFRPTTTHLLSNDFSTNKSKLARTYGIPIMKREWIEKCWEVSLSKFDLYADDKKFMDKFRLPIFTGFRINTSQMDIDLRTKIQNLITKNGGEYVEFRPKNVTHLILGDDEGDKKKYNCAKNTKNIKIMKAEWVQNSINAGYPLMEYDYLYEPTNTPPIKFDFSIYSELLEPTQLQIKEPQQNSKSHSSQIYSINQQNDSQINSLNRSQQQLINGSQIITPQTLCSQESTQKDCPKPLVPEPGKTYCVKSKTELAKSNSSENSTKRTAFSVLTSSQSSNNQRTILNPEDDLQKLVDQMKDNCRSSIFDGCEFFICDNFQDNIKILLKRCITLQNGTISTHLRKSVNHVIVKEDSTEIENIKLNQELRKFDHNINQVNLRWIVQCSKSNKLVPLLKMPNLSTVNNTKEQRSFSQQSNQPKRNPKLLRHNSYHNQQPLTQQLPIREIQPLRVDDIFNDYSDVQSNVVNSSLKLNPCVFDLDLMTREEKPLFECVLTISSYQVSIKDELTKIAKRLGATCQSDFVKTTKPQDNKFKNTHLVCDYAKGEKYLKAIKWNVHVVNQNWLRKCEEAVKRLDEKDFLPEKVDDLNQKSNGPTNSSIQTKNSKISSSAVLSSNTSLVGETVGSPLSNKKTYNQSDVSASSPSQTVEKELENLKTKLKLQNDKTLISDDSDTNLNTSNVFKIDILNDDRSCFKNNNSTMTSIPIAWNDQRIIKPINNETLSLPVDRINQTTNNPIDSQTKSISNYEQETIIRPKLVEKKQTESFQIYEDSCVNNHLINNKKVVKDNKFPAEREYQINFIGCSPQEKLIYSKELAKFNIKVTMDGNLDYDFLVTQSNKFTKNECFFVSLAKGKWIVHPDFYHKIVELGKIPNPEEYEWGTSKKYLSTLESKFMQLAKACRYWRIKVQKTKKFAFHGQNLLIVSVNAKNYASIIQNGGGNASAAELQYDSKENFRTILTELYLKLKEGILKNYDFVLINYKKNRRDELDLLNLIRPIEEYGIKCLHIDYVTLFLISDDNFNIKSALIDPDSTVNLKRRRLDDDSSTTSYNKIAKR